MDADAVEGRKPTMMAFSPDENIDLIVYRYEDRTFWIKSRLLPGGWLNQGLGLRMIMCEAGVYIDFEEALSICEYDLRQYLLNARARIERGPDMQRIRRAEAQRDKEYGG